MKKILIIFTGIFFCQANIYSQINFRLIIGVGINNSVSYLKDIETSNSEKLVSLNIKPGFSYSVGGTINYKVSKNNKIALNLFFSDKSFKQLDIIPNTNFTVKNYFLSTPLYWQHLWFEKAGTNIGIVNNIFLKNSYAIKEGMNFYNLGLLAGGYYNINNKIELSADFQFDITPYSRIKVINSYQQAYNYGAILSLSYKLFGK